MDMRNFLGPLLPLLLSLSACSNTKELQLITAIPRLHEEPAAVHHEGASRDSGSWVARSVYEVDGSKVLLKAIEVLYCPHEGNTLKCRLGVAWTDSSQALAQAYKVLPRTVPPEQEKIRAAVAAMPSPQAVKVQVECKSEPPAVVAAPPSSSLSPSDSKPAETAPPPKSPKKGKKK